MTMLVPSYVNRAFSVPVVLSCLKHQLRLASTSDVKPLVTLYTKKECSLCDILKEEMQPHYSKIRFEEVDITLPENKPWFKKYKYDIPVLHINGKFMLKHRFDHSVFLKMLSNELSVKDEKQ